MLDSDAFNLNHCFHQRSVTDAVPLPGSQELVFNPNPNSPSLSIAARKIINLDSLNKYSQTLSNSYPRTGRRLIEAASSPSAATLQFPPLKSSTFLLCSFTILDLESGWSQTVREPNSWCIRRHAADAFQRSRCSRGGPLHIPKTNGT